MLPSSISNSLLLLLLGGGTLDLGSGGDVESSDTLESLLSGSLGDVRETLDNFSDSVDASLEDDCGNLSGALRVILSLGDLVVALVLLEEGHDSLGSLLALDVDGGEAESAGVGEAGIGGVVETGEVQGVAGELLTVGLHEEGVPLLGKLPHNSAGDLHVYTRTVNH